MKRLLLQELWLKLGHRWCHLLAVIPPVTLTGEYHTAGSCSMCFIVFVMQNNFICYCLLSILKVCVFYLVLFVQFYHFYSHIVFPSFIFVQCYKTDISMSDGDLFK